MNKIKLSTTLKSALELRHSKVSDERDRIKAVLLRSEGWKISMIAQALRIHESTITRHINDFLIQQKLTADNGGSNSFLNTANRLTYFSSHRKYLLSYLSNLSVC